MKTTKRITIAVFGACALSAVLGASALAQAVALKPGFALDPAQYPSLAGYSIADEELDVDGAAAGSLARHLYLERGEDALRITVAVGQNAAARVDDWFDRLQANSECDPSARFDTPEHAQIQVGDKCIVGAGSTPNHALGEIAFRRQNVFVAVQQLSDGEMNVLPIALEIDAALRALPDVSDAELLLKRPRIETFRPMRRVLHPGDTVDLRLVLAPGGTIPPTRSYDAAEGDVAIGSPDRYTAGALLGRQVFRVIVWTPQLLFTEATNAVKVGE